MFIAVVIFIFGCVFGSFLTAYSYRWPRGITLGGRSFCVNCNKQIAWYDNIPLFSFILLNGKCRSCGKKISIRYPLIELFTGLIFVLIYLTFTSCLQGLTLQGGIVCSITDVLGIYALPYLLSVVVILGAIFIIDSETQMIPDRLIFILIALFSVYLILFPDDGFYLNIYSSFALSLFFLCLHFITRGKGMGLGDVKFVIAGGLFFGWPLSLVWVYTSFIIGAVAGVILMIIGKAKFKKPIAFGPFLVISWIVAMIWGEKLVGIFIPYL